MLLIFTCQGKVAMAKESITDQIGRTFELEMPFASNQKEYLDAIIPQVRPWSQDLWEEDSYENHPWLEVSDEDDFHKTILHFFNSGGEYLRSIEGNVKGGSWRFLEEANKLMIEYGGKTELYELSFLTPKRFFILRKHGNPEKFNQRKYLMMIYEPIGRSLEWRDAMELLYNTYRNNNSWFRYLLVSIVLIIIIAVLLSM